MKTTEEKKPSNFAVAIYLAENYRDKLKSDEDFKKVAAKFNFRWKVLKKHYEEVCAINDIFS